MKRLVKRTIKQVLYTVGYYDWRGRVKFAGRPRLMVVMYHDVAADGSRDHPDCVDRSSPTVSEFATHVRALARRHQIVTLRDGVRALRDGSLQGDAVALTFDDGYRSVYTRALPVLERNGVPATVFLLTGWINGELSFWWHELRDTVRRAEASAFDDRAFWDLVAEVTGTPPPHRGPRPPARAWASDEIENRLRSLPDAARGDALARISERLATGARAPVEANGALSWKEVRELAERGIELGAHTRSHPNLRDTDAANAESEIVGSRDEIERRTGQSVHGFAYPYGKDVDCYGTAAAVLRDNGFEYACTTATGINTQADDVFLLQRVSLPNGSSERAVAADAAHMLTHRVSKP